MTDDKLFMSHYILSILSGSVTLAMVVVVTAQVQYRKEARSSIFEPVSMALYFKTSVLLFNIIEVTLKTSFDNYTIH